VIWQLINDDDDDDGEVKMPEECSVFKGKLADVSRQERAILCKQEGMKT
jgi:hypothetical protein